MIFPDESLLGIPSEDKASKKDVYLHDKDKTISFPSDMHDEDVNFYLGVNEYGKSPKQSFWDAISDLRFWEKQETKVKELAGAVGDYAVATGKTMVEDAKSLGKSLVTGNYEITQERLDLDKEALKSTVPIMNAFIETFVGRVREPIRTAVGDVMAGETQNIGSDIAKTFIDPSNTAKIANRTPFTEAERSGNTMALLPRAVGGAIEDVLFYGTNFKDVPKMIDNYQINATKKLMQKNVVFIKDNIVRNTGMTDAEAFQWMGTPEGYATIYRGFKKAVDAQPAKLYSGVPIPGKGDINAAGEAVAKSIGDIAKPANAIKPVAYNIVESVTKKESRLQSGYTKIVTVDAAKLKEAIEKRGQELAWNPKRLEQALARTETDAYPLIDIKDSGRPDVTDGGHRIAAAASRGQTIQVATKGDELAQFAVKEEIAAPAKETPTVTPPYKERKFVQSVREEFPELNVEGVYKQRSTEELAIRAKNLIKDDFVTAERMAMTGTDEASVAVGSELIKYYDDLAINATDVAQKTALFEKATEVANSLAIRLTELGRAVQAAQILSKMSPEGQVRFAARTIQKYNEDVDKKPGLFGLKKKIPELKPEQVEFIVTKVKEIEKMPIGEEKAIQWKELQGYISDLVPTPLYKKIATVWKAGLLTGIKTSGLNIMSNTFHGALEVIKDAPAAAVDGVASLFTKERTVAFTVKGSGKGAVEGFKKGLNFIKTGFDERGALSKLEYTKINFGKGKIAKALQIYEESIFKFIGAQDQAFYYGAKARSIYEQAIVAAKNEGLKGKEAQAYIDNIITNPSDDIVTLAVADAETAVFQNETTLSKVAGQLKKIPGAEFIMPFTKTPSAVAMQVIRYTPVGGISTIIKNIGAGKFDQRSFSKEMGRSITGVGLLFLGGYLLDKGILSLDRSSKEGQQKLDEIAGKKPNSILIGDKWRSVNVLGPAGNVLLIGAQFKNAYNGIGSSTGAANVLEANSTALANSLKSFTQQTFLTGVSAAADAISDPYRSAGKFTTGLISSTVPTIVGDLARATDRTERRVEGIGDALASRIPGLRSNLEPKIDISGNPVSIRENFIEIMADPSRPVTVGQNPVVDEIQRIINSGNPISTVQLGDKTGYSNLTTKQNTYLFKKAGIVAFDKIHNYMLLPQYESFSDEKKARDIDYIFSKSRNSARADVLLKLTEDKSIEEVVNILSKSKKSGLLSKEVYKLYKKIK